MSFGENEKDPGWQYLKQSAEQVLKDQSKPYDSKKNVWVPDAEDGYVEAEITATKGDNITVNTKKGNEVTLKKELVQEMNPPKFEKTEDMSNLSFLNDASVLHNLRSRYGAMLIYTYSGLFCVVINPYKRLPIYTDSVARMYMNKRKTEMPPHLFAVSDEAYRNMLLDHENQSMLITGESGAGKTENTKKVIAYFAAVGASQQEAADAGKPGGAPAPVADGKKKVTLEDQIVQTNPVLEAFGNAKTVRNNNSSRFGKFIRIHFSKQGRVASCDIEHYLLEKSRVIRQAPGERCYHIFYQIYSDFIPSLKAQLQLDRPLKEYWFVAQAELTIDGVNDKEEHGLTDEAFDILLFTPEEKLDCYRLMSALMHMGNMKFKQRPREEQAEPDGTDEAEKAAAMYGVNHEEFLKSLTKPRVRVGTEWVAKGQNIEQVNWAVGATSKGLYARVFHWLVTKCNITLDQKGINRDYFIGVLDIAGFEIFDFNSFEQLWINFVNEKLQQFFNHHMFVLEQEEYAREGIQWTFIDFGLDLAACIELIEKPMGIISMLDEECIVPKATDLTLAQKLVDQHLGKHPNFEKPKPPKGKQAEAHFAMRHYAGTVRYNVTNWLEKNKDPLNDTLVATLKNTKGNALLNEVWQDYQTQEEAAEAQKKGEAKKKGKSGSMMTVSMTYRQSLDKLMTMLHKTHPHFIRCIIPNEKKASGVIDAGLVLNQLTCNGVLEGIRICRKGFPNRTLHPDFRQRYAILAADEAKNNAADPKKAAQTMTDRLIKEGKLTEEQFRIGDTKVFFKAGVLAHLEDLRDEALRTVITGFQTWIRWHLGVIDRKRRNDQRAGLLIVQRNIRGWISLRQWDWFKLYGSVKSAFANAAELAQMAELEEKLKAVQESIGKEEALRKQFEGQSNKLEEEKNAIFAQLEEKKSALSEIEAKLNELGALRGDAENSLSSLTDRLAAEEEGAQDLLRQKKKVEGDVDALKKQIQDLQLSVRKSESEKSSKEHQIRSLQDELAQQDEAVGKLNKEKKHQEEVNRKLTEDLQGQEDKNNHTNKLKSKLEQTLDELEDSIEREKRAKAELDKAKRKVEGEVKIAQETLDEGTRQRHDLENNLKKKESELHTLSSRLEDEQSLVAKLQRQIKEQQARIGEVEDELENERQSRAKADRAKSDLQRELEEINERLDEQGGATASQFEVNKKREAELAKLRRDLEEANLNHESQLGALRKKHTDGLAELTDQIDQIGKAKAKLDKERQQAQRDAEDLAAQVDVESSAKLNNEKLAKQFEVQIGELQSKADEQARQLQDFISLKGRLSNEQGDLARQLEDTQAQLEALTRVKSQLLAQIDEARRSADDETRERQVISAQLKNNQAEAEAARGALDEEIESKNDVLRQLAKANSEVESWKSRLEGEGLLLAEELEEAKRRQLNKINELQEALDAAHQKIASLDKTKSRLAGDLDDAQVDVERANAFASQLEKKQQGFDRIVDEWKKKTDDLAAEVDAAQRDARAAATDLFRAKTQYEEALEAAEGLRRENKALGQEIKDLTDQLGEGGRSVHELQKLIRRIEVEKEEIQRALDEAESALEAEESKVLRAQVEVSQIRAEIEKRIQEKEAEFDETRKNHQRALESIQATLENESRGKTELLRIKKKLEGDINELEIALDHANKANSEAQKNLKRGQEQIRELQIQADLDETLNEFRAAEERAKKAIADASSLAEQLRQEQEHSQNLNRAARGLEQQIKEAQVRLDEAEAAALKGGKKVIAKLEQRVRELEQELDGEQRRQAEVQKNVARAERQARELQFQVDEDKKNFDRLNDLVEKLQGKLKSQKKQIEEAEEVANQNLQKYRQIAHQVEDAEERADVAENSLSKLRSRSRAATSVAPSGGGLQGSASAAVLRSASRARLDF